MKFRPIKDGRQEAAMFARRAVIGFLVIFVLLGVLGVRFWYLQVSQHDEFQARSDANRILTRPLAPARGLIYDRNGELLAGRYADIQLKQKEIEDAIAIPSEAIVPEMGKNKVFVYRSGVADPVDVIIGLRTEAEVQIVRGLSVGDTILTSGTLQLRKGMPVELQAIN